MINHIKFSKDNHNYFDNKGNKEFYLSQFDVKDDSVFFCIPSSGDLKKDKVQGKKYRQEHFKKSTIRQRFEEYNKGQNSKYANDIKIYKNKHKSHKSPDSMAFAEMFLDMNELSSVGGKFDSADEFKNEKDKLMAHGMYEFFTTGAHGGSQLELIASIYEKNKNDADGFTQDVWNIVVNSVKENSKNNQESNINNKDNESLIENNNQSLDGNEKIDITQNMVRFYLETNIDTNQENHVSTDVIKTFNVLAQASLSDSEDGKNTANAKTFIYNLIVGKGAKEFATALNKDIKNELNGDDPCYQQNITFNPDAFLKGIKQKNIKQSKTILNDFTSNPKQYIEDESVEIDKFHGTPSNNISKATREHLNDKVILYASKKNKIMSGQDMKADNNKEFKLYSDDKEKIVSRRVQIEADKIFSAKLSKNYNTIWANHDPKKNEIEKLAKESLNEVMSAQHK